MTAVYAIIMFCVLIFVHEMGHFLAAKACDVKVNKFALGMGPAIIKFKKGETEYSLRVLPIGGYCAMEGEDEESDDGRAFNNKPAWKKAIIVVAGSFMNVILAIIIMIVISYSMGTYTTTVDGFVDGSPAVESGLQKGDKILNIDGKKIDKWEDISASVTGSGNDQVKVVVNRKGQTITLMAKLRQHQGRKIIGITPTIEKNVGTAIVNGPRATWNLTKKMYDVLKQLFTGQVSTKELTGPVGIIYMVNETSKAGIVSFLFLVALISLNLGIVNMLPLPALDGGRLLFIIIRKFTGKSITDEMEGRIQMIGILLLFALMIYVTWNDIVRFIFPIFK